jgi:phenylpropionate dioxygenase-like ring-hydroxylating dioxygenase large terminal subunit
MSGTPVSESTEFLDAARPFWHPVGRSVDLDPGAVTAVTLLDEELVLWRTRDGHLGLTDDLCSHRGTRLSAGRVAEDGCITCPYHAWSFAADGECVRIPQAPDLPIPARAGVRAFAVAEQGGLIWACLDPSAGHDLPLVPEADTADWHVYAGEPMDWRCQSTRQIENFLDIAHFSVLHTDAFGNPDAMEVPPHEIDRDGIVMRTSFEYPGVNMLAEPGPDGRKPLAPLLFDYTVRLPFHVRIDGNMAGQPHILTVGNQPVTATTCRVYWVSLSPSDSALPDEIVEMGEQMIFHPDRAIVETQRPERVPLDLTAELHLGFDKLAVAYRRALADLGFPVLGRSLAVETG